MKEDEDRGDSDRPSQADAHPAKEAAGIVIDDPEILEQIERLRHLAVGRLDRANTFRARELSLFVAWWRVAASLSVAIACAAGLYSIGSLLRGVNNTDSSRVTWVVLVLVQGAVGAAIGLWAFLSHRARE